LDARAWRGKLNQHKRHTLRSKARNRQPGPTPSVLQGGGAVRVRCRGVTSVQALGPEGDGPSTLRELLHQIGIGLGC